MAILVRQRFDIDLDAFLRVAWQGEAVTIDGEAVNRVRDCRETFLRLVDSDPEIVVYGVTTGYGDRANVRLTEEERAEWAGRPPATGATFGDSLPDRVARGIVLARLANFVEGHAAVRPELVLAVAGMLDGGQLPPVPIHGNGGSGEILALGCLFRELASSLGVETKETLALVNGSPCAAALVADASLAARRRLELAEEVFALSAEAMRAPLEAYSADLEPLWGDEHEQAALRSLRDLLADGSSERRSYQAPVSFRILPRVLGQTRRALAAAEQAAAVSLRSVSDNPVYIPPDAARPLGAVISTGGYHNGQAYPALDALACAWADLCQLAERQTVQLLGDPATLVDGDRFLGLLSMVQVGFAEEARQAAQPTFLTLGGAGQNDTAALTFLAWDKERRAGAALESGLAALAAIASQSLQAGAADPPPALARLLADVRGVFPPLTGWRPIGPELGAVAGAFTTRVYSA
jgi:histidine ammonia-lyase